MGQRISLPTQDGMIRPYVTGRREPIIPPDSRPPRERSVLAAVHVVADPLAAVDPWSVCVVDWDATLAYRRYVWSLGLGVAEAMDTAQRGMGVPWRVVQELIRRSAAEARSVGGRIASGVNTDQLAPNVTHSLETIERAYAEQLEFVEGEGSQAVLMCSRALAATAKRSADYYQVYARLLAQAESPVIIHWLGPAFDGHLTDYWGSRDPDIAQETLLGIIAENVAKVDGIKISLLDADREVSLRRLLPRSVRMYTGDDFNFPDLIAGDELGHSDALLGIFDAIAPIAAAAMSALDGARRSTFLELLAPTVPLAQHLFAAPTHHYKTGIVFMAYLNGHQDHFTMVGGHQSARSAVHLAEIFRLADQAGAFQDPDMAAQRCRTVMTLAGVL